MSWHVCMYVCVYVCMYVCMCVCACMDGCMYACMFVCMYAWLVCMYGWYVCMVGMYVWLVCMVGMYGWYVWLVCMVGMYAWLVCMYGLFVCLYVCMYVCYGWMDGWMESPSVVTLKFPWDVTRTPFLEYDACSRLRREVCFCVAGVALGAIDGPLVWHVLCMVTSTSDIWKNKICSKPPTRWGLNVKPTTCKVQQ